MLFAMVDADYCFTLLLFDIGANGQASDSAIFRDSRVFYRRKPFTVEMENRRNF